MAQIDIMIPAQTVERLRAGGYSLYAFKAMQTNLPGTSPLVWYRTQAMTTTTTVAWRETYQVFNSQGPITPGAVITPHATLNTRLGMAVSIAGDGSLSLLGGGGFADGIDVFNYAFEPWNVGLSQVIGDGLGAMFAVPVYSEQMKTVKTVARVLLLFSEASLQPGEVMEQAAGPGVFVDFTGGESQQTVEFDLNQGWTWGGAPWAQAVPAGANIQTLLVEVYEPPE